MEELSEISTTQKNSANPSTEGIAGDIAKVFASMLPKIRKNYLDYVNNYGKAANSVEKMLDIKSVASVFKVIEKKDSLTLPLQALVALPLQRVNQYSFWMRVFFKKKKKNYDYDDFSFSKKNLIENEH